MEKTALITGITGQDGSYLAELLLSKGYEVHGIVRRSSSPNTSRIDHLIKTEKKLFLHDGDLTDTACLIQIIKTVCPHEIYNLAAQSHVAVSFESPEFTANVDALGTLRILEAIRVLGITKKTKFYQASSSELYGLVQQTPQNEATPFYPRSPYGVAKLYSFWITKNYRESYGVYACNGILFNHESPRRGETFVTRKITRGLCDIALKNSNCLYMGNLDSLRDWGHARDYVQMQWLMLQQEHPDDYVIATGKQYSVRDFIHWSADELGIELEFSGTGVDEIGTVVSVDENKCAKVKIGDVIVRVDHKFYRPAEVDTLLGDPSKAEKELGWFPTISAREMCSEMVRSDLKEAQKISLLRANGLTT